MKIGIVIPVYLTTYINQLINQLKQTIIRKNVIFCVVNDGQKKVKEFLKNEKYPDFIEVLNLKENKRFAGANNAGWKYLIRKYPKIKYLGSLNDDTIPKENWLEEIEKILDEKKEVGLVSPTMIVKEGVVFKKRKEYGQLVFQKNSSKTKWITNKEGISPTASGYCFLAKRKILEKVNFFDEGYSNSCEDVDLCLKIRKEKKQIYISTKSKVFHCGGKSRYKKGTNTKVDESHQLLRKKWGIEFTKYNNLNYFLK